jgi:hypothetical protein
MRRTFLFLALTASLTSEAMAFHKLDIGWCDEMLDRYERCLRGVTYEKCEVLAQRYKMSRTYQAPTAAGRAAGPHTYATPAAACLGEVQDLIAEMSLNARITNRLGKPKQKEEMCSGLRSIVTNNSRTFCGK